MYWFSFTRRNMYGITSTLPYGQYLNTLGGADGPGARYVTAGSLTPSNLVVWDTLPIGLSWRHDATQPPPVPLPPHLYPWCPSVKLKLSAMPIN